MIIVFILVILLVAALLLMLIVAGSPGKSIDERQRKQKYLEYHKNIKRDKE